MTKRLVRSYENYLKDLVERAMGDIDFVVSSSRSLAEAPANVDMVTVKAKVTVVLNEVLVGGAESKIRAHIVQVQTQSRLRVDQLLKALKLTPAQGYAPSDKTMLDVLMQRNMSAIKGMSDDIEKELIRELTDGIANGESMRDLIKRVDGVTGFGTQRSEVIARTETLYAYNTVAKDRYKRNGIEEVEWLTATDERVCDQCGPLDGQRFKLGLEPDCPIHPQCRCSLIPVVEGF